MNTQPPPLSPSLAPSSTPQVRPWWDSARIVIPSLFLCLPIGLIPLWKGTRFSRRAKIAWTGFFALAFFVAILAAPTNQSSKAKQQATASTPSNLIPFKVLRETGTLRKGQWQVEVGLIEGRLPSAPELQAVAEHLAKNAGGFETHDRYFVEFYFPGMADLNGGSETGYALAKLDPENTPSTLVRIHTMNADNWPHEFRGKPIPNEINPDREIGAKRFALREGLPLFLDKSALLELLATANEGTRVDQEAKWKNVDARLRKEKRSIYAPTSMAVTVKERDVELAGYVRIAPENPRLLPEAELWIKEGFLEDGSTLIGANILGGELVFDGSAGISVGQADIADLIDLLMALSKGRISEKDAARCIFTKRPKEPIDRIKVFDDCVLYATNPLNLRLRFAVERRTGDQFNDPLFNQTGDMLPVKFKGWQEFQSEDGALLRIPCLSVRR